METLPKDIQLIVQTYMKPSEILAESSPEERRLLFSNTKEAWEFWARRAYVAFAVSREEFMRVLYLPYDRYLRFYTANDGIDYGCERHETLGQCAYRAVTEGNIPLLTYFYELVEKLQAEDIDLSNVSEEYKHASVSEIFTNSQGFEQTVRYASNFLEVLAFLINKGLSDRHIEIAWLTYYLRKEDYMRASSLMRNDTPASDAVSLADEAFFYAILENDLPLAHKLRADFPVEERLYIFLDIAIHTNNPEVVQFIVDTYYAEDARVYDYILERAKNTEKEYVFAYYTLVKMA